MRSSCGIDLALNVKFKIPLLFSRTTVVFIRRVFLSHQKSAFFSFKFLTDIVSIFRIEWNFPKLFSIGSLIIIYIALLVPNFFPDYRLLLPDWYSLQFTYIINN